MPKINLQMQDKALVPRQMDQSYRGCNPICYSWSSYILSRQHLGADFRCGAGLTSELSAVVTFYLQLLGQQLIARRVQFWGLIKQQRGTGLTASRQQLHSLFRSWINKLSSRSGIPASSTGNRRSTLNGSITSTCWLPTCPSLQLFGNRPTLIRTLGVRLPTGPAYA